uniref:Uncharacterized protein n=1 Tax=Anguilla anguilla TaxID=7936 RepID=A0A0E9SVL1_ANGAN
MPRKTNRMRLAFRKKSQVYNSTLRRVSFTASS